MSQEKIGIIREGKTPPDSRVPLNPTQCKALLEKGYDIVVQPSQNRCFKDEDYVNAGVPLSEDLTDRDVLLGVKEVPIDQLIPNKTYFFFSHTIKEQSYNRDLLKAIVDKNIRLIDYEVLTTPKGARVIAFGKFAGMVGAHNGMWTYAQRSSLFYLPRMKDLLDYKEAKEVYAGLSLPPLKIVLTGTGRVSGGAAMVLEDMGVKKVSPMDFVTKDFNEAAFTQLNSFYYVQRKDGKVFDSALDFYQNPKDYTSDFDHFVSVADIFINGIYWDNDAPAFFTLDDIKKDNWNIEVIADVTCDIAPVSSIPTTIKASTIQEPVFGIDRISGKETKPYEAESIDMMTIDNLPNELPRDASTAFGKMFIEHVLEPLMGDDPDDLILRATVAQDGALGPHFQYLTNYLAGK